jgi:hypothetical protein
LKETLFLDENSGAEEIPQDPQRETYTNMDVTLTADKDSSLHTDDEEFYD